jgi:hypothetical protein
LKFIAEIGVKPLLNIGFFKHTAKRVTVWVKIRVKTDVQDQNTTKNAMNRIPTKNLIFALCFSLKNRFSQKSRLNAF